MKKYLIAVDLDGTLLPDLYGLTEYSIRVFNKIREEGHTIIISTGRPFRSSYFVYQKFGLNTPMINYNGGLINNPSDPSFGVYDVYLKRDALVDIYKTQKEHYYLFFSEHNDNIYSNIDDEHVHLLMHHSNLSKLFIGDIDKILPCDAHGTLILAKPGHSQYIKDYVEKNYSMIGVRIWEWAEYKEIVELYSKEVSKGSAVMFVAKRLGFDKEHILACGDSPNDIELFKEAGVSVSLSNAEEHIKKISTYVYPVSCGEDGLAKFMVDFFKLKI